MDYFLMFKIHGEKMIDDKKSDGFTGQRLIVLPKRIVKNIQKNPLTKSLYLTDIGYFPRAVAHFRIRPNGAKEHISNAIEHLSDRANPDYANSIKESISHDLKHF